MSQERNSYRSAVRATSIFGGVQILLILFSIVRAKFTAKYLGPEGLGVFSLYTTTYGFIISLTNFSLGVSAVKDVSEAFVNNNKLEITRTLLIIKKLMIFTGFFGMAITILFSPLLSISAFGNYSHTLDFIFLSIIVLITQLTTEKLVLLQGMRNMQSLAKANLFGNIISFFFTIPLYIIYGPKSIVTVLILISITQYFLAKTYSNSIKEKKLYISKARIYFISKKMLKNGFAIGLTGMLTIGFGYLLNILISRIGGTKEVGLFAAGFMIVNNYTGLVFAAIASDYHPRLSALTGQNTPTKIAITQQAELAFLLLCPLVLFLIVFLDKVILILYNKNFIPIENLLYWVLIGILFKAVSWAISFVFVAQGKVKLFFWNEIFASIYVFLLNIAGYYFYGLEGLGASYFFGYLLYFLHMLILSKKVFEFTYNKKFITLFVTNLLLISSFLLIKKITNSKISLILGVVLILYITFRTLFILEKRIEFLNYVKMFFNKLFNNKD